MTDYLPPLRGKVDAAVIRPRQTEGGTAFQDGNVD